MRILTATLLPLLVGSVSWAQPAKPIVYVLSTGGTIAGSGSSSTDLSNYKPGAILGEQLVKAVPQIAQIADVRVEQVVNVSSSDITIENWLTLAKRIHAILKETPAASGFVITSGTNTLEETAYFLNLTDQFRQTRRPGRIDAAVDRDQRRWSPQPAQRGTDRDLAGCKGQRRADRAERRD